ncbi:ClpXP protease specificity-enhancing factor SspB [uncultured Cohaesibacter sp.]|uniref:SspB family protein n=1 Tax=uncultured Cohaesibacter sp. TaxID=1002546 RepID=UPI0029C63B2B|nr:ClpXP protease specificity-enhancing factor SspB [uncultured Cohaesibacter sp.]
MSEDLIRYDILAQDALRGVVKTVLTEVARTGLPGDHHFYITFNTQAPGVRLSPRLLEKYPEDMTIVLQHQFWDLQANEQAIEIGLSFDGIPEKLYIPYTAIITFIDPSVHFSLQFEVDTAFDEDDVDFDTDGLPDEDIVLTVLDPTIDPADEINALLESAEQEAELQKLDGEDAVEEDGETPDKTEGAEVVSLDAFRKK